MGVLDVTLDAQIPSQRLIDSPVITSVLPHSGHCVSVPIGGDSTASHSELPDSALNPHR